MNLADLQAAGATALSVRAWRESDRERWDRFVFACPDASFFHRIGWREIFEHVLRHRTHYLLAERGEQIVGVLPLVQLKSLLFGHSLVSLPFAVYGGVAATDPQARTALHRLAIELARELGVERFFELYADNQHRHGTPPHSIRYFQALKRVFGDDCEMMNVLSPQGKAVSGVLSFYFRDEVLPYYAGDFADARELAANDFKYWELMRRACERGLRVFDYGRSKRDSGSFAFKKNWGFEPAPLHYEYQLFKREAVPQNNPSNPKYQRAIEIWRKLPRGVVNAVGPVLARHLG